jgi:4-hydroxy-4-methyl-2-oxoglutarate aldolase
MNVSLLEPAVLEELRSLDSCTVANAIETFHVRLRNSGFTDSGTHCIFPELPPMVGYAVPMRIRTSDPPMEGESYYYRLDWLDFLLSIPAPRVLVVQDVDPRPGLGSFIGDVHANILKVLGGVGVVTNGAVRDLNGIEGMQFQLFAGNLSVSHSFSHVLDFGAEVVVANMNVRPGDLIHGDRHGVQTVPLEIASQIPGVARTMAEQEDALIRLCRSPQFSTERLRADIAELRAKRKASK